MHHELTIKRLSKSAYNSITALRKANFFLSTFLIQHSPNFKWLNHHYHTDQNTMIHSTFKQKLNLNIFMYISTAL